MASLAEISSGVAAIVERSATGVVRVAARGSRPASGIVWADNLVLTANHAVEREEGIEVSSGRDTMTATLAGRDPATDIALLRTAGLPGLTLPRGRAFELRLGHLVLALGRPDSIEVRVGIVSSLGASFRGWRGGERLGLIETSAGLRPGFSGGPLLDEEGRIVGVNSWNYGRAVSRALPVGVAEAVAEGLARHGRVRRAYLGIGTQPVQLAAALSSPAQAAGLLVVTVDSSGPAAKAGVLQGDVLLAIDGHPVRDLDDLFSALGRLEVEAGCRLRLLRAAEVRELTLQAGERPI